VQHAKILDDVVVVTMFSEAKFIEYNESNYCLTVSFLKKFSFFKDRLDQEKNSWYRILQNIFGHQVQCNFNFEHVLDTIKPIVMHNRSMKIETTKSQSSQIVVNKLDISDTNKWQLANELMHHFDGILIEISGNMYD